MYSTFLAYCNLTILANYMIFVSPPLCDYLTDCYSYQILNDINQQSILPNDSGAPYTVYTKPFL